MRAPLWLIAVMLLLIVGLGVYGYFTTQLPFGLSAVFRNPGAGGTSAPAAGAATRTAAGQPLVLGALTVMVENVQRNQELFESGGRGPGGMFTVLQLGLQNGGAQAITMQPSQFQLVDDRGRTYAVDVEATRMANQSARRRAPFEATVPPGGRLETALAFETAADTSSLSLRVTLGYGEVELAR